MRELFAMWRDARMVSLTAVIAALYMTALIPFKGFVLVEGFTEVRLASALPVTLSLLFGPAAAWGAGFGNLFSDVFGGTFTAGSVFGFVGNFFAGFVGYRLWGNLGPLSSEEPPTMRSGRQLLEYLVVAFVTAAGTAAIIAWGLELLGLFPFSVFATIVALNNFVAAAVVGPPLLYLLYPRVDEAGFTYPKLLSAGELPRTSRRRQRVAAVGLVVVATLWLVVGVGISVGLEDVAFGIPAGTVEPGGGGSALQSAFGAVAFLLLLGASIASGERISSLVRRR